MTIAELRERSPAKAGGFDPTTEESEAREEIHGAVWNLLDPAALDEDRLWSRTGGGSA